MDQRTAETARRVAEIVSQAGLTQSEIRQLFEKIDRHLTVGGFKPFCEENNKTPEC